MKYLYIYLFIINIVSLVLMFVDKNNAINRKWRISENKLFLFALLGGSIGSILGMNLFRHKTKHLKFKLGLPAIFIFQFVIFLFLIKNI